MLNGMSAGNGGFRPIVDVLKARLGAASRYVTTNDGKIATKAC